MDLRNETVETLNEKIEEGKLKIEPIVYFTEIRSEVSLRQVFIYALGGAMSYAAIQKLKNYIKERKEEKKLIKETIENK